MCLTQNSSNLASMKTLSLLFFVFLTSIGISFGQNTFPEVNLKTLSGEPFSTAQFKKADGPQIIAFWATWCGPCITELSVYSDLYEEWKEKYNVEIYAISIDTRRQLGKVPAKVESLGWEFPIISDINSKLQSKLGFASVPQVILLDKNGVIINSHSGYAPGDEEELEEKIKKASK